MAPRFGCPCGSLSAWSSRARMEVVAQFGPCPVHGRPLSGVARAQGHRPPGPPRFQPGSLGLDARPTLEVLLVVEQTTAYPT
eukprot:10751364-Lingulodinium_polyedra.AAC.1